MVFGRGRVGRPGLLGTVARTAVVAGTANATSNAMNRRRQSHEQQAQDSQSYRNEQQQAPPPVAAPPAEDDLVGQIQKLAAMRDAGVLDANEFAAAKAKLLA
ncbi:SHOCT domain-containing protein [Rhodococcus sp. BP22]|uniref:SHOCT domain-containing protein n=1 Tax=Rhodococcus sp. BP22 TaxID=2758566 RepID=UPI001645AB3D|nr:SHOCT domain-containing protein [Rhodococcus sp. BP22]